MSSKYNIFKDLDRIKDKTNYFKNLVPEARRHVIEYEELLRKI